MAGRINLWLIGRWWRHRHVQVHRLAKRHWQPRSRGKRLSVIWSKTRSSEWSDRERQKKESHSFVSFSLENKNNNKIWEYSIHEDENTVQFIMSPRLGLSSTRTERNSTASLVSGKERFVTFPQITEFSVDIRRTDAIARHRMTHTEATRFTNIFALTTPMIGSTGQIRNRCVV